MLVAPESIVLVTGVNMLINNEFIIIQSIIHLGGHPVYNCSYTQMHTLLYHKVFIFIKITVFFHNIPLETSMK